MQTSKKTYNLSAHTVQAIRLLAQQGRFATTQDGIVERAVADLARRARDLEHERLWGGAMADPTFQAELAELAREFGTDDRAAWEIG